MATAETGPSASVRYQADEKPPTLLAATMGLQCAALSAVSIAA